MPSAGAYSCGYRDAPRFRAGDCGRSSVLSFLSLERGGLKLASRVSLGQFDPKPHHVRHWQHWISLACSCLRMGLPAPPQMQATAARQPRGGWLAFPRLGLCDVLFVLTTERRHTAHPTSVPTRTPIKRERETRSGPV